MVHTFFSQFRRKPVTFFIGSAFGLVLLSLAAVSAYSQRGGMLNSSDKVGVSVAAQRSDVIPGADVPVAVIFDHEPNWHIHTNNPQVPPELGKASFYIKTEIKAELPPDSPLTVHNDFIQWPKPHTVEVAFSGDPVPYDVFSGKAIAYVPVSVAPDAEPGEATLRVYTTYQACDDSRCLAPVKDQVHEITFTIHPPDSAPPQAGVSDGGVFGDFDPGVWQQIHEGRVPAAQVMFDLFGGSFEIGVGTGFGILLLLIVAAFGGFLLNLTPCVLPVIPLKVMGLSQAAGDPKRYTLLGLSMALGVVAFWLALGAAMASISGFTAVNQLFQQPWFTLGVGGFIALMAVSMCGLFSIPLPSSVYRFNPRHDTVGGSFVFGIMTAVLSTPCTAPFMGAALGWSTKQSALISISTFLAIGTGMALPYIVLALRPRLVSRIPRVGPASELVKQVMGLLMLGAASYFFGVGITALTATSGEPPSQLYWLPVLLFVAAAGVWLTWRTLRIAQSKIPRLAFSGLGVVLAVAAFIGAARFMDMPPIQWVYYTPERFQQAVEQEQVVLMDFTAEWCLNCKALEESVLHHPKIVQRLKHEAITPMKVDLTSGNNKDGNAMLARMDRLTIPLLVIFGPDGEPVFKSDFYTVDQLTQVLDQYLQSPPVPASETAKLTKPQKNQPAADG